MAILNINTGTSILVMLSSDACPPCYIFGTHEEKREVLPAASLRDILMWAAEAEPVMPELFFLVGKAEKLDSAITSVLNDMAEQVVTPLMPLDRQELLGIPFSRNQTVVADSVNEILTQVNDIAGRPVILHIGRDEIDRLAEHLLAIQDYLGSVTLRLRDIHLLTDNDLVAYEEQLAGIIDVGFMKSTTGTEGKFNLEDMNLLRHDNNQIRRCPAGNRFMVIGPDGCFYPCTAFYHDGKQYALGSVHDTKKELSGMKVGWDQHRCGMCNFSQCAGCPFLETSQLAGKNKLCEVHALKNRVIRDQLIRISQSGYLFDCLRIQQAKACAIQSQSESDESLTADRQMHNIPFTEFTQALKDIKLGAELLLEGTFNADEYDAIINKWKGLQEASLTSQRNVFRRRVSDILRGLQQFKCIPTLGQTEEIAFIKQHNLE